MRLPILTNEVIGGYNPRCFIIYSDNILESTNILDLLAEDNEFFAIVGVSYEPIDQPVYLLKAGDMYVCIKVAGKYENWDLPQNIDSIIHFIDKPDFVIADASSGKPVFVGETTGTANVGNSQWQREGRKISAAVNGIPMIYQTYYSGTDRSMIEKDALDNGEELGQVREPSSLQVINHFIYSLRYRTPSLLVYYPNSEYDISIGFGRDNKGKELLKNYISLCILFSLNKEYKSEKKRLEKEIYQRMLGFITEQVNYRKSKIYRIDKDFPVEPVNHILKHGEEFIDFIVDFVNGDIEFKEQYDLTNWDFKTFSRWSHRYSRTPLLSLLDKHNIPMFSYLKGAAKAGFVIDTQKLLELLDVIYVADAGKFHNKLNPQIPTLIIPTLMFQSKDGKFIHKVDPGTGEIVAFSELFARDIRNKKSMNTLIYVHVPGPNEVDANTNKLFRAIKRYADCLIINERIYEV